MSWKLSSLACASLSLALLSGCASMRPLPVREPQNLAEVTQEWGGLPPATGYNDASANLTGYGNYYLMQANDLHASHYRASDTGFAGGLIGMAGGLTKSPQTAIAGAVLGGGGAIANDRYQFQVQAQNYEKAADAMFCMKRVLISMDDPANRLGSNRDVIFDVLFLNEKVEEVRRKLRKNQATVQLASPDLTKLQATLADLIKKKDAKVQSNPIAMTLFGQTTTALALASVDKEYFNAELTKCVDSF